VSDQRSPASSDPLHREPDGGTISSTCNVRGSTANHVHRFVGHCCAVAVPLAVSHAPRAAPGRAAPGGAAGRGTRPEPRPGWSANPATPCASKRCAHVDTESRLVPIVAAMAVIGTPAATRTMILPRLARPAGMVVARCHASSVRRSAGVRVILREVLRPRAIVRPCVRQGSVVVSSMASTHHTARHGSTTPGPVRRSPARRRSTPKQGYHKVLTRRSAPGGSHSGRGWRSHGCRACASG
jgi:hypothetical protein